MPAPRLSLSRRFRWLHAAGAARRRQAGFGYQHRGHASLIDSCSTTRGLLLARAGRLPSASTPRATSTRRQEFRYCRRRRESIRDFAESLRFGRRLLRDSRAISSAMIRRLADLLPLMAMPGIDAAASDIGRQGAQGRAMAVAALSGAEHSRRRRDVEADQPRDRVCLPRRSWPLSILSA